MGRLTFTSLLFAYLAVLLLVSISNLGVFNPNWPFELFSSFMRQLLVLLPIFIYIAWRTSKRNLILLGVVSASAFWPLATFSKFISPSKVSCKNVADCSSIIFLNMHRDLEALNKISQISMENDVDFVALSEVPAGFSNAKLAKIFPNHPYIRRASQTKDGRKLGSIIALVSKYPFQKTEVEIEDYPRLPRAILVADVQMTDGPKLKLLVTHPRIPLSHAGARRRGALLNELPNLIGDSERFVIVGDFNLAPWTPAFHSLPGLRAGDPRLTYTWKVSQPYNGITIDHIMVGRDFDVVEAKTLAAIGSDHRPVYAKLKYIGTE